MAPRKPAGGRASPRAGTRATSGALKLRARNIKSEILKRIASEVRTPRRATGGGRRPTDIHIKNSCDLHGKGNHIKGAGPNYLKDS